jgi:hypothetical protein
MVELLTPVSPKEAIALGAKSLIAYGKLFHPKSFRQSFAPMHDEMGQMLYSPTRLNEFLCFRGSAKTTLLRGFASQRIAYGISRTIMCVSSSQGHAIHSVRWLKRNIENNPRLKVFGLRPGSKWTDEWIEIEHQVENVVINVFAVGITGQTRGFNLDDYRPDLIIGDDILDDENSATEEQREKIKDRWDGSLINSLSPQSESPFAKAVLAQTPFHRNDLAMVNAKDPAYNVRIYSCFDEAGKSRWEERFPTTELLAQKASATARGRYHIWMREMECQVVLADTKPFDISKIRFWDDTGLPPGARKLISVDPASSDSRHADQHVVSTVYQSKQDFFVAEFDASTNVMPDRAWNSVRKMWLSHPGVLGAVVEVNGYQRVLKWYFEQEMAKSRQWIPIMPWTSRTSKSDRIIGALAGLINYGHLWIHSSMAPLLEQLDNYNPNEANPKDDIIDAISLAVTFLNPSLAHYGNQTEAIDGEFSSIDDEAQFAELEFGGCP